MVIVGGVGLGSDDIYLTIALLNVLLFLLELQGHLLMRPAEDGDIGGLQHFQEVYLVPFGDDLDEIVDVDVE
jgi:hypothetical protein